MQLPPFPGTSGRHDWRTAFDAVGKLLATPGDTVQVFRIMRALNVRQGRYGVGRLLATLTGGQMLYRREELARKLAEPGYIQRFAPGTVGHAYARFLAENGFTPTGLEEISREGASLIDEQHPYAWYGRRVRDVHDIWHVLTGYRADETLGEACLVAFSYAQLRGLGWAFIGFMASLKSLRDTRTLAFARAVWEGYRNGRAAGWLPGEDYDALFAEPLDAARARLNIRRPVKYEAARQVIDTRVELPGKAAAA